MTHVVWVTLHPDIIARGPWDTALLDDILTRAAWEPVGGRTFEHCDGFAALPEDATGAVVVIPGQHHTGDVAALQEALGALEWALVLITGDEESRFPWEALRGHRRQIWCMTPRPGVHEGADGFMGEGYAPWFRDEAVFDADPQGWFFAGQITHKRREVMARKLRKWTGGTLVETAGFTQGLDHSDYAAAMAGARVVLCPSGPGTPDSFRLYEALEAGALPIADGHCPQYPDAGYWSMLFGEVPFPVVEDWTDVRSEITRALDEWPANANRASAWWQQEKRALAYGIEEALDALEGPMAEREGWALIDETTTVVIPTSPIPSHPSTAILEETLESVREQLPHAEIVVVFDGVRAEQEGMRAAYEEYTRRALWLCNHRWTNVVPIVLDTHQHQANATRAALELVRTPLILFVEHDTPVYGPILWESCALAVLNGSLNLVRFHHEAHVLEPHQHLMVDAKPIRLEGAGFLRTMQWSQRPHLAGADWYRGLIRDYFGRESRTMIEDSMHGVVDYAWRTRGEAGWKDWRLALYAPKGGIKRSGHLDGREGEEMHSMTFAYDGPVPLGAPAPSSERDD